MRALVAGVAVAWIRLRGDDGVGRSAAEEPGELGAEDALASDDQFADMTLRAADGCIRQSGRAGLG